MKKRSTAKRTKKRSPEKQVKGRSATTRAKQTSPAKRITKAPPAKHAMGRAASKPVKQPRSPSAAAGDSTWGSQPASGDWNTAGNWSPAVVPADTATFRASTRTTITFAANSSAAVKEIDFASGASAYTFVFNAPAPTAPALTIAGAGVSNESVLPQRFVVASSAQNYKQAQLKFINTASAGRANTSYSAGPSTPAAAGGGVIGFYDRSTAGSAQFTVTTGAGTPPRTNSTVGGEVSFSDFSNAGSATFTVYGSTSTTDGDTFGNAVFHDNANAASATFTNAGGTVKGGDGGNTQFYDNANAGSAYFHNYGGTVAGANGGDVAFDGTATAAHGHFHNYAATAAAGYGGVTSFNNNPPSMAASQGATAGSGKFFNYGANASDQGGGHTYFTAKYGSPSAANGTFVNYGSAVAGKKASTAGHTVFSISVPQKGAYAPNAGSGLFWNFPGGVSGAPGGYTQFTVYADNNAPASGATGPSAANATCINVGGVVPGAQGGSTSFSGNSSAANAMLIALRGHGGGYGGIIAFYDQSSGGAASVLLHGNGTLDLSLHQQPGLTIGALDLDGGIIEATVGSGTTSLAVTKNLAMTSAPTTFNFKGGAGIASNTPYTILTAPNLSSVSPAQFRGNVLSVGTPVFSIAGNALRVTFNQ